MAYTPKTWVTGETIEATELNHMEQGIAAADQSTTEAQETADEAKAIVAGEFLTTKTYTTGEYCIHSGELYRFTADKTAGAWDSTKVVAVALANDVADLRSAVNDATKLYKSDSVLNKFDIKVFDSDIGYAPQGLAVWGNTAFVSNGATPPLNVITEIDLISGQYTQHTVDGLNNGGNCLTIDYDNYLLYVADHSDGGVFHEIDMNTWEIIQTYDVSAIVGTANIAYDPFEKCFYVFSVGSSKFYKFDKSFSLVESVSIDTTDTNKYPTHNAGASQGIGYDGTYFYMPRSEVEALYGNSIIIVYDKTGKIVTYFSGDHNEIEDISYDFTIGKYFACYAQSDTGYITQYVEDTGWLNLYDYLSGSYSEKTTPSNVSNTSTAKFRVYKGNLLFKGDLIVNSFASGMNGAVTYVDARISAPNDIYLYIIRKDNGSLVPQLIQYPWYNQYISKFKQLYFPVWSSQVGTLSIAKSIPYGTQRWD